MLKISTSHVCDKQYWLWYATSQNMEVEYELMAQGRKCGLSKCHPLSQTSTHHAYTAWLHLPLHSFCLVQGWGSISYTFAEAVFFLAEETIPEKPEWVWHTVHCQQETRRSMVFLQYKRSDWKWWEVRSQVWTRTKPQRSLWDAEELEPHPVTSVATLQTHNMVEFGFCFAYTGVYRRRMWSRPSCYRQMA